MADLKAKSGDRDKDNNKNDDGVCVNYVRKRYGL